MLEAGKFKVMTLAGSVSGEIPLAHWKLSSVSSHGGVKKQGLWDNC